MREASESSFLRIAEVVCQRLNLICSEVVLIPQHMIMGRPAGALSIFNSDLHKSLYYSSLNSTIFLYI